MIKTYLMWNNIPLDLRAEVMSVISTSKINFDKNMVNYVRTDFWDYSGESDNGRMMNEGKTCTGTYRIPDIDNLRVYVTPMLSKNSLSIDFYDKEAYTTQFVYIYGGVRY